MTDRDAAPFAPVHDDRLWIDSRDKKNPKPDRERLPQARLRPGDHDVEPVNRARASADSASRSVKTAPILNCPAAR